MTGTSLTRAQHGEDRLAVEVRQAKVEQDDVGGVVNGLTQTVEPVRGARRGQPAVAERPHQEAADRGIVFDDEHMRHDGYATRPPSAAQAPVRGWPV